MRIIAPSGPVPEAPLREGLAVLREELGFELQIDDTVVARDRYLAGDDASRADAVLRALSEPDVDAVICARGGYGASRLLHRLPPRRLRACPIPVVGFSDVTALHAALGSAGVVSLHGPVVTQLGRLDRASIDSLRQALAGSVGAGDVVLPVGRALRPGRARGPLAGGNLSLLASLCGTRWGRSLAGTVVVIEDVGEPAYRVDRMIWQLRRAADLDSAAALVVGDFTDIDEQERCWLGALWEELATQVHCPLVLDAPVGHGSRNYTFPLGIHVELDTEAGGVRLLEPAHAEPGPEETARGC